jgi:hypothetical protein
MSTCGGSAMNTAMDNALSMSSCGIVAMNTVSDVNPGIARQGHLQPVSPKNRTILWVEKMTPSEARYYAGSNPL